MGDFRDVAFTVCLRAGSRRLPKKNVMLFGGTPLFMLAINQARCLAERSENVIVSTDDEAAIEMLG